MGSAAQGNLRAWTLVAAHKELMILFTKEIEGVFIFPVKNHPGVRELQSQEMKTRAVTGKK